ncbi:hypothetical protein [Actinophytocola oryzae]|uniref:hypothetical protein n=1 Tax=Actinophytocola oryzae TaxID=502181 RepID=UPI00106383F3|nr:hypothetical protein [Actinophytocola oryzae]
MGIDTDDIDARYPGLLGAVTTGWRDPQVGPDFVAAVEQQFGAGRTTAALARSRDRRGLPTRPPLGDGTDSSLTGSESRPEAVPRRGGV